MSQEADLYNQQSINFLELIWGKGYLSPGGPEEVSKLLSGLDLNNAKVLDIGCGSGGITLSLVRDYGASKVTGIDVETPVCHTAREYIEQEGYCDQVEIIKVKPGPFPFPDQAFDFVFSKDSIIHIPDKESMATDVFRILKPGGWFVASDWLISHDDEPSDQMKAYIKSEGLEFAMASPGRYQDALESTGFENISFLNRNKWYFEQAKKELQELQGPRRGELESAVGNEMIKHNIDTWIAMVQVLATGEHCPHHFRGQRPSK